VSRSPAAARKSLETVIWPRHQTNDGGSFLPRSEIEVALTTVSETIPRIDAPAAGNDPLGETAAGAKILR
jgi:hypothetical protein